MATGIEGARLLTQKSAWMIDNVIHFNSCDSFSLIILSLILINLGKKEYIIRFDGETSRFRRVHEGHCRRSSNLWRLVNSF